MASFEIDFANGMRVDRVEPSYRSDIYRYVSMAYIVFLVGEDPVRLGLVSSLARPTGNLTGINMFTLELEAKRLELLHQFVPQAARIAVFVDPADVRNTENTLQQVGGAARARGFQVQVLKTKTAREIDESVRSVRSGTAGCAFRRGRGFLEHSTRATSSTGGIPPVARDLFTS